MTSALDVPIPADASPAPDRLRFYVGLTLAVTAAGMALLGPALVLLPDQAEAIHGMGKVAALALITGIGGLASLISNPIAGVVSDRTRSRLGRRRPWVFGGAGLGAGALLLLSRATSLAELTLHWTVLQVALNLVFSATYASIPDHVPESRRGTAGACLGVAFVLGPLLGAAVAAGVDSDPTIGYPILAAALVAAAGAFVLAVPDSAHAQAAPPAFSLRAFPRACWDAPRQHPDFGWAWLSRISFLLGFNLSSAFLLYFLEDEVRLEDPEDGLAFVTLLYALSAAAAAMIAGRASDRVGRRKPFVLLACALFAAGALPGGIAATWTGVLALGVLTGAGVGVHEGASIALISQVLPSEETRARDMGIVNVAQMLPFTLGPAIGAPLIALGGYETLYAASALAMVAAAICVRQVRGVP